MLNVLRGWIHRYFSDEEAVVLAVLLVTAFAVVLTLGDMLAPVLAAQTDEQIEEWKNRFGGGSA